MCCYNSDPQLVTPTGLNGIGAQCLKNLQANTRSGVRNVYDNYSEEILFLRRLTKFWVKMLLMRCKNKNSTQDLKRKIDLKSVS